MHILMAILIGLLVICILIISALLYVVGRIGSCVEGVIKGFWR